MSKAKTTNFIKLNDVRISFPNIFAKKVWPNSQNPPEYEATFLLDKKLHLKELELLNNRIDALLIERNVSRAKIKENQMCLKDGDLSNRDEYAGYFYLKTKSKMRIPVVDKDAVTPLTADDEVIFAGCYVSTCIGLYYYDKEHLGRGKGVSANLKSIQFRKKGPSLVGVTGEIQDIRGVYEAIAEDETEDEDIF